MYKDYFAIHINYKDGSDITFHLIYEDIAETEKQADFILKQPSVKETRIFPVRICKTNE